MRLALAILCLSAAAHAADADPPDDADAAAADETVAMRVSTQNTNRDRTEAWGYVELLGSGKEYEFIKATFGAPLHCGFEEIRLADPADLCEPPSTLLATGAVLVADRGGCSFADKAYFAQTAGAVGVIMVSNDQSMPRLPAAFMKVKDVVDPEITIPMVTVRQTAGKALKKVLAREPSVMGAIVAKKWSKSGTQLAGPCSVEYGKTLSDDKAPYNGVEVLSPDGGVLTVAAGDADVAVEYLRGDYGGPIPNDDHGPLDFVVSDPLNGCSEPINDVAGKIVLVWRGGCSFTLKSHTLEEAGARGMVVVNNDDVLLTMAEGEILEDYATIYSIMIGLQDGDEVAEFIKAAGEESVHISFAMTDVMAADWDTIEILKKPEDWSDEEEERTAKYAELVALHDPTQSATGHHQRLSLVNALWSTVQEYWADDGEDPDDDGDEDAREL